jgi:hypothetical protein
MSEASHVEQEQQAPTMRETVTGPLLPRWFTVGFYSIFIPFCIYSAIHITLSFITQSRLRTAISSIRGSMDEEAVDLKSPAGQAALGVLRKQPILSFLYLNQEMFQNEDSDPRMARALALEKAVGWERTSSQRALVTEILANMLDDGSLPSDFQLDGKQLQVLKDMVDERRANTELTYVENRITDVLAWVAGGHQGPPSGTEKRRLAALHEQLAKKVFLGSEAKALKTLMEEWSGSSDAVRQQAAERFAEMLKGEQTALSPEGLAVCQTEADRLERAYENGMTRLAEASRTVVEDIVQLMAKGKRLDHPHIYQYLSLLSSRFDGVREQTAAGAWLLRHNQFTIRFLSFFATKTTINPFMAVETLRLTREEHEREMRRANIRRMRLAVELLGRIGVDYLENPDSYQLKVPNRDEFMGKFVASALLEVADEESIADVVQKALDDLRAADAARAGGPLFESILGS